MVRQQFQCSWLQFELIKVVRRHRSFQAINDAQYDFAFRWSELIKCFDEIVPETELFGRFGKCVVVLLLLVAAGGTYGVYEFGIAPYLLQEAKLAGP